MVSDRSTTSDWNVASVTSSIVTPPAAPSNLSATGGNTNVALTWNGVSGAASYTVKRASSSGGNYAAIATIATAAYTDPAVTNGLTYYYTVTTNSGSGQGGTSAPVK